MKLIIQRNRGALLLGLLVIVLAIVIIGLAAYAIYKAIQRLPRRTLNPDDVAQWAQSVEAEMTTNIPPDGVLSDGTQIVPLGATVPQFVAIEMSTNLVDWFTRTNIPVSEYNQFLLKEPMNLPAAFYRIKPAQ